MSIDTMTDQERCHEVLHALANPLVMEILDLLARQPERFNSLHRQTKANTATLSKRLQLLVALGVITRAEESIDRQSVIYTLTPLGLQCLPMVAATKLAVVQISR